MLYAIHPKYLSEEEAIASCIEAQNKLNPTVSLRVKCPFTGDTIHQTKLNSIMYKYISALSNTHKRLKSVLRCLEIYVLTDTDVPTLILFIPKERICEELTYLHLRNSGNPQRLKQIGNTLGKDLNTNSQIQINPIFRRIT